ncbi:MAG: deoxyribose-phosphate aldolase [Ignavibacteriae bacterium]|nr:deoxyribose-phosphate aldolase [Ignavibacteriota bacterium]
MRLAHAIDHTLLKPDATVSMIETLCDEAIRYGFATVCVNPCYVELAVSKLLASQIRVCTVIGFPLGASTTRIKVLEASNAIMSGAKELDIVLSIGSLVSGDYNAVVEDLSTVVSVAAAKKVLSKVIIETCLLNFEQKLSACAAVNEVGADFIKTSTGFSTGGATIEDVKLLRSNVGRNIRVKASGGIKDAFFALSLLEAGAERIGTSNGVTMMGELSNGLR